MSHRYEELAAAALQEMARLTALSFSNRRLLAGTGSEQQARGELRAGLPLFS